jgi:Cu+-exporting ATPase
MKSSTVRDPVCGMEVDPQNAAASAVRNGETFYFCSRHCRAEFLSPSTSNTAEGVESDTPNNSLKYGMALERDPSFRDPAKTIYTCPMHPQIEQDHPGNCPICGMTLEPKNAGAASEEENAELRDMTRRLWIGGALTLPVFVVAMAHLLPNAPTWADGDPSRWMQFVLSTPVVVWAGWPFFVRGWQSLVSRSLNMFTLIAMGIGVAWLYSAIVMLALGVFPPSFQHHGKIGVYFEAAAVITVLVLVGQVLELRARSHTGNAIRPLLDLAPLIAHVLRDGAEHEVPLHEVQRGDQLRVCVPARRCRLMAA